MNINLDREDLFSLIKGSCPNYSEFNNPLVLKAGHSYSDQYGRTYWSNLKELSDEELLQLYYICKNSWNKNDTLVLVYEGIDDFSRPVFKDDKNNRYGSVSVLFFYGTTKKEVLDVIMPFDLCYFGTKFNCEPLGTPIPERYKTIKLI